MHVYEYEDVPGPDSGYLRAKHGRPPQRVARVRVIREPVWTEDDMRAALEWQEWEDQLCSCGHPRSESFDPASEGKYEATALRCFACEARDRTEQRWRSDQHANLAGVHFAVHRVDED